jgi:hypothetical protein
MYEDSHALVCNLAEYTDKQNMFRVKVGEKNKRVYYVEYTLSVSFHDSETKVTLCALFRTYRVILNFGRTLFLKAKVRTSLSLEESPL